MGDKLNRRDSLTADRFQSSYSFDLNTIIWRPVFQNLNIKTHGGEERGEGRMPLVSGNKKITGFQKFVNLLTENSDEYHKKKQINSKEIFVLFSTF